MDGSNIRVLTNNKSVDGHPKMSPDGKKIIFFSKRDSNKEVYIMNADGSNQTRLTNDAGADWSVAWSPDSSKIAFISNRDGDYDIYIMNSDGSELRNVSNNEHNTVGPNWLVRSLK